MKKRVAVLALQGDFAEHETALQKSGAETFQIRQKAVKLLLHSASQPVISAVGKALKPRSLGNGARLHRCFGIAANMDFLLVCTYEENGENPELVIYKKR